MHARCTLAHRPPNTDAETDRGDSATPCGHSRDAPGLAHRLPRAAEGDRSGRRYWSSSLVAAGSRGGADRVYQAIVYCAASSPQAIHHAPQDLLDMTVFGPAMLALAVQLAASSVHPDSSTFIRVNQVGYLP